MQGTKLGEGGDGTIKGLGWSRGISDVKRVGLVLQTQHSVEMTNF